MKKLVAAAALGALVTATVGVSGASAGAQDFTLHNSTGYDIAHVYVSVVSTNSWEEDIMGRDLLAKEDSVKIHFAPSEDHCHYDLKVTYTDGETAAWGNINLCTVNNITIHYNRGSGETSAETD